AAPGFVYREADKVVVKGRTEGIAIFEPPVRVGEADDVTLGDVDRFHKVLEHHRAQRSAEADAILNERAARPPDGRVDQRHRERIFHYLDEPRKAGWNGVWVFKTK